MTGWDVVLVTHLLASSPPGDCSLAFRSTESCTQKSDEVRSEVCGVVTRTLCGLASMYIASAWASGSTRRRDLSRMPEVEVCACVPVGLQRLTSDSNPVSRCRVSLWRVLQRRPRRHAYAYAYGRGRMASSLQAATPAGAPGTGPRLPHTRRAPAPAPQPPAPVRRHAAAQVPQCPPILDHGRAGLSILSGAIAR